MKVEHKGIPYQVNEGFYRLDFPEELDKNWIDYVRACEGMQNVTSEQMEVVNKLREYYKKNRTVPKLGLVSRITGYPLKRVYDMFFPRGPSCAGKMAGFQQAIC